MSRIKTLKKYVDKRLLQANQERASTATIIKIDGNLAAIRLSNHQTNLNHCRIVGDPEALSVGQTVSLRWEDYNGTQRPVVMGPSAGGGGINQASGTSVVVDNESIEYSDYGLRVKPGGIGLEHLNFVPATADHTHKISEWLKGWDVTDDGILFSEWTSISPDGAITLGRSPDLVVLDASDADYRIWAGHIDPSAANFSVSKSGAIKAHSGDIAGWTITSSQIKKNEIVLDSANDRITVGQVGAEGGTIILDGASKMVKSENFQSGISGFGLYATDGNAEFNNVVVRGTIRASVMNIGEVTATAGSFGVFKSASEVYENLDMVLTGQTTTLLAKNSDLNPAASLFSKYDVLRVKAWNGSSIIDVWMTIYGNPTAYTGYTSYPVLIESGGGVGNDLKKGMAIVDYGQTNSGYLMQSADDTIGKSANFSIATIVSGGINTHGKNAGGSGYAVDDLIYPTQTGAGGAAFSVTSIGAGSEVLTYSQELIGQNYRVATNVPTTSSGSGTGFTMDINSIVGPWNSGQTLQVRLGNMYGSYGTGAFNRYGIGIGDYDTGNYLSYNAQVADAFKISAGGEAVTIDGDGISVVAPQTLSATPDKIKFIDSVDSSSAMEMFAYTSLPNVAGVIELPAQVSKGTHLYLNSRASSLYSAAAEINAASGTASAYVLAWADDTVHNTYGEVWIRGTTKILSSRDLHASGGIEVGGTTGTPSTGQILASSGGRFGGALMAGSTTLGPGAGNIGFTGNLKPYKNSQFYNAYTYVPLQAPLTAAAWEGLAHSTTGAVSINLVSTFGLPSNVKAVAVRIIARDSGTHPLTSPYFAIGPTSIDPYQVAVYPNGSDMMASTAGVVNTNSSNNALIYYRITASGTNTLDAWIRIWGYYI